MISYVQALETALSAARPLGAASVEIEYALGHCLANAVSTSVPIPRFDNSSVDGYGVLSLDTIGASPNTPVRLSVASTIGAGEIVAKRIKHGCVAKIFTGGPIPSGVDAVVMREDVEESDPIVVTRPVQAGVNIRRAGEEFKAGGTVLGSGIRVTPAVVGLLAQLGVVSIEVVRKPSVGLIITGNEFASSGHSLTAGKIYDSNTPSLVAALTSCGIDQIEASLVPDAPGPMQKCLEKALRSYDVVITVGGISMGDYDYVRPVLTSLGVIQQYWQVAMKPGKPNYFGMYSSGQQAKRLVFGLPGNPVSALVSFLVLVKPALKQMLGDRRVAPDLFSAKLTKAVYSESGRLEFVRGRLSVSVSGWEVEPVGRQGSHMLGGLTEADCLIHCPQEFNRMEPGDTAQVQLIDWL